MFEADILISIVLMSLLFLRHISVYKDRNKINYTPVVAAIGFITGLLHFVILGDGEGWLLVLRESLLTVIVGSILSTIMSVMSQTQSASNRQVDNLRMESIQEDIISLQNRMEAFIEKIERFEAVCHPVSPKEV
ncbi:MAG: hypothetical protein ACXWB0_03900 [Sulfuricurvum sp.]